MRGHDALLTMRRAGKVPQIVFVDCIEEQFKQWRDWQDTHPAMASIWIEPTDIPAALDLRCLVGLLVSVNGMHQEFVDRVVAACLEAGAGRVLSTLTEADSQGYHKVTRITDTTGAMTHG